MPQGLTFPQNPTDGQTITFQFTHTGGDAENNVLTRTWSWDARRGAWVGNSSNASGAGGAPGAQGPEGPEGSEGPQGPIGIVGLITGGGIGMISAPRLSFNSSDASVVILGITSDSGITIDISGGGANPQGPETSIQFKSGASLSGISEATIVTDPQLLNPRGFSGNFVYYTESPTSSSTQYSTEQTITVPFGSRNTFTIDNIALNSGVTLTINGISSSKTGASMTLILGHTGASGSSILFPGSMGIYWSDGGPFGVTSGTNARIYPRPDIKRFDVLYFFADGTYVFGNLMNSFKQSR